MRSLRLSAVCTTLVVLASLMLLASVPAGAMQQTGSDETGYGARKPVFGGSGPTSGWGAIGTVVREALAGYGWDVQLCRSCAGAARAARLVAGAEVPARPRPGSDRPPPPNGPLDFGATGPHYLWWAYEGTHDYADDAEGPRRGLRLVANIQTPSYFLVAVEADSGITDLGQIEENGSPVRVRVHYQSRAFAPPVLDYYGLSEEAVEIFGGPAGNSTEAGETLDVMIGFGSLSGITRTGLSWTRNWISGFWSCPKTFGPHWHRSSIWRREPYPSACSGEWTVRFPPWPTPERRSTAGMTCPMILPIPWPER